MPQTGLSGKTSTPALIHRRLAFIYASYNSGFWRNIENETKPGLVIETAPRFPIHIGSKAYACRDEVCKFESGEDEGCVEYSDSLGVRKTSVSPGR